MATINESKLQLLGLTEKEATVYIKALGLGQFSVADIATKSGLKRPTCYLILDELVKRGFISVVPHTKTLVYIAENPDVLIKQAEQNLLLAKQLGIELQSVYKKDNERPVIKFYSGQKGIRNIYEDVLKSKSMELYYVGSSKDLVEMVGEEYMKDHVRRRVLKGMRVISIRMRDREIDKEIFTNSKDFLREIRYAPKELYVPDTVFIYGNKIAIISTKKGSFGLMMESDEVSQTVLCLFKALWQISSEK